MDEVEELLVDDESVEKESIDVDGESGCTGSVSGDDVNRGRFVGKADFVEQKCESSSPITYHASLKDSTQEVSDTPSDLSLQTGIVDTSTYLFMYI